MINKIQLTNLNKEIKPVNKTPKVENTGSIPYEKTNSNNISFNGFFSNMVNSKKFKTPEEKYKYKELYSSLDNTGKKNLEILSKTGRLQNASSNDGTSTLDNLHKIISTPRVVGLDKNKILNATIKTLINPFLINQNFGDIPNSIASEALSNNSLNQMHNGLGLDSTPNTPRNIQDVNVESSGTCVSASVEFNLADKKPAEFARFVEGLTSPELCVKTKVHYSDIAPNFIDAVNLLNMFNVEYKTNNWNEVELKLQPDRDAIVRARVQNTYKDPGERSLIDVLMQSTFMQLGSQGTYNSLTDKRYGSFNPNDKGLTEFEKNFTEAIVDNDGGKTSITYQVVDDNAKLVGYNLDFATTQKHLLDALNSGSNVIVGITETDTDNTIIGGHEMTIINTRYDKNNELYFMCNDTDDDYDGAIEIKAKDLLPKIHHAGIPTKVISLPPEEEIGYQILNEYNQMQAEQLQAS